MFIIEKNPSTCGTRIAVFGQYDDGEYPTKFLYWLFIYGSKSTNSFVSTCYYFDPINPFLSTS